MKRILTTALLIVASLTALAQKCPNEWMCYTTDAYFHDVESGVNDKNLSEAKFKSNLLDLARTNLSKQIQVRVEQVSQTDKNVVDGKTHIVYNSSNQVSTDVDMQLSESKSYLDPKTGEQYVIVYINKEDACKFYENEVKMAISKINNAITISDNYIASGFKAKAKTELKNTQPMFEEAEKDFFWLNVFGMEDFNIQKYLEQVNQLEQTVKLVISDLEYGVTYCVVCKADNFGKAYTKLENELKGELSKSGCNFVDDPKTADFVINVNASAREFNMLNNAGGSAYFSYVDAAVSIDKVATNQRIFEDNVTVKGSHTLGYSEAGREGYKRISKEISKLLKDNIKL